MVSSSSDPGTKERGSFYATPRERAATETSAQGALAAFGRLRVDVSRAPSADHASPLQNALVDVGGAPPWSGSRARAHAPSKAHPVSPTAVEIPAPLLSDFVDDASHLRIASPLEFRG